MVKVGSFAKTTSAATVDQAITSVGFKPRALILWTTGATADETWADSYRAAVGWSARNAANTITAGSAALASLDAAASSNSSRRLAAKALTIVEWGESVLAECDLKSCDADGFTLTWTTNNAVAYIINYMALGGNNFTDAYVKAWSTGTGTGNKAITGVGFQPDVVLHLANAQTASTAATAAIAIGAMTSTVQWTGALRSNDAQATMSAYRTANDAYTFWTMASTFLVYHAATYVSMDEDGFTVNATTNTGAGDLYSLCLKGGSTSLGIFNRLDTTGAQEISTAGFQPEGVWFVSVKSEDAATTADALLSVGATDGTNERSATLTDDNSIADSNTGAYTSAGKALVISSATTPSIVAGCDTTSLDSDGFTINWATADGAEQPVYYFAFAGGGEAMPRHGFILYNDPGIV